VLLKAVGGREGDPPVLVPFFGFPGAGHDESTEANAVGESTLGSTQAEAGERWHGGRDAPLSRKTTSKRLAAIAKLAFEVIPEDPDRAE
jgi:hypothetical protein